MKKRGLLLVSILMLFSFLTAACGSSEDNEKSGEKEKKEIELTIDQTTVTTDENGKALIEGTVDPKAKLSIDGTTVKQDSDGDLLLPKLLTVILKQEFMQNL